MKEPGPFRLAPVYLPKVWAAPQVAGPVGEVLAAPPGTGEVWLASDRHHVTPVVGGELDGMGLDAVVARWRGWLWGGEDGPFPLLLKVLSVGQWLSVQVHPDDEAARRLEGEPWGKSEAWHVLAAEPEAEIILGLRPGVDRAAVEEAVRRGRLVELLARVPARAGDTFHLPAGTIHATGPGLTIFEIQQASDITYRFYDWDRLGADGRPRPLHIDQALAVMKPAGPGGPVPPQVEKRGQVTLVTLVDDPHFRLRRLELSGELELAGGRLRVFFLLSGRARLEAAGYPACGMAPGQCWLVPAGLEGVRLAPEGAAVILESQAQGGEEGA